MSNDPIKYERFGFLKLFDVRKRVCALFLVLMLTLSWAITVLAQANLTTVAIAFTTATRTMLVQGTTNLGLGITYLALAPAIGATPGSIQLITGSSNGSISCGTGTINISGPIQGTSTWALIQSSGGGNPAIWIPASTGSEVDLCAVTTNTAPWAGWLTYFKQ